MSFLISNKMDILVISLIIIPISIIMIDSIIMGILNMECSINIYEFSCDDNNLKIIKCDKPTINMSNIIPVYKAEILSNDQIFNKSSTLNIINRIINSEISEIMNNLMLYAINENYSGICAMDIGYPVSICVLRNNLDNKNDSRTCDTINTECKSYGCMNTNMGDEFSILINFNITSISDDMSYNEESNHFCRDTMEFEKYIIRSNKIKIEYIGIDGFYIQNHIHGKLSFILQHLWELNNGILICNRGENKDKIEKLYSEHYIK